MKLRHETREHWFSYGDCCLAVSESMPANEIDHTHEHVLFFLHGRFGQGEMWGPLIQRMALHFRCLHMDLPGFGRSFVVRGDGFSIHEQAALFRHLLRRFLPQNRRAVIVGHDIGGAIAQLCAIHDPSLLAGMVLINSATLTHPIDDLSTGWFSLQARRRLRKLLKTTPLRLGVREQSLIAEGWDDRTRRASLIQAFRTWEQTWPGPFERLAWRERLRRVTHPVLLLWGLADLLNPVEHAEELMRCLPEAYLFEHEGCGHWPNLEDPSWVEGKLREFLFRLQKSVDMPKAA